ncbi:MAG: glycosyltransferase family 39 protein [Phycisphaerae bacterium]|nr:glycosyltransferase family 39 protein [Phycisphaerae bacterium]
MQSERDNPLRIDQTRWLCLALVVILVVHVTGRVGAFCSPIRADSYAYSGFAWRIAQGDVLYRDLQVDKPPGLLWLLAPVYLVAPAARWPLIPWESAWMLAGYWAFYRAARELYAREIALTLTVVAVLAVNVFLLTDYTTEGFSLAESYLLLPIAGAVALYWRAARLRRWRCFAWVGALLGACLALKQTALPLLVAVAVHATVWDLIVDRSPGRWATRAAGLLLGFGIVAAAVAAVLAAQGVLPEAWHSMTTRASGLLRRETGWPGRWRDVVPLWVPLGWCALGVVLWAHSRLAPRTSTRSPAGRNLTFLLFWLAAECLMLVLLPRRSFHYYAISCLPVILLSGLFWAALLHERATVPGHVAKVVFATAVLGSAMAFRPTIDRFVPVSISLVRSYDAVADSAAFEKARQSSDIRVR